MNAVAQTATALYRIIRPLLFRQSAQAAHEHLLVMLKSLDNQPLPLAITHIIHRTSTHHAPVMVGGAVLNFPLMLAAGFVKGQGFESEADALAAVRRGENIMPGWRCVPALLGQVEFGSFTRHPRSGNDGIVLWRDSQGRSLQNRIGLKNPGAAAAAAFLAQQKLHLPSVFGVNIAISPGVTDVQQQQQEVSESLSLFLEQGVVPAWFTLNLSCPNTEDDPTGHQSESLARDLCTALVTHLQQAPIAVPLWVKLGPDLSDQQYTRLVAALAEAGVSAIIATNTLGQPAPQPPRTQAGVSGQRLFPYALHAAAALQKARFALNANLDIIACGGITDGPTFSAYRALGIHTAQVWTALVYRGPLALQLIESETHA